MRNARYLIPVALVAAWVFWPRSGRLDDMGTDAHAVLFRLPGVVRVTRSGPTRPARRVVHVLDYHMLPDDLARADITLEGTGGEGDVGPSSVQRRPVGLHPLPLDPDHLGLAQAEGRRHPEP
jgi:hypothetical protein